MKCIKCNKIIEELKFNKEDPNSPPSIYNRVMWEGGIIGLIEGNYGSLYDGDKYIIALCDDCITQTTNDNLLYTGNEMSHLTSNELPNTRELNREKK